MLLKKQEQKTIKEESGLAWLDLCTIEFWRPQAVQVPFFNSRRLNQNQLIFQKWFLLINWKICSRFHLYANVGFPFGSMKKKPHVRLATAENANANEAIHASPIIAYVNNQRMYFAFNQFILIWRWLFFHSFIRSPPLRCAPFRSCFQWKLFI